MDANDVEHDEEGGMNSESYFCEDFAEDFER